MPIISTPENQTLSVELFAAGGSVEIRLFNENRAHVSEIPKPTGFNELATQSHCLDIKRLKYSAKCVIVVTDDVNIWWVETTCSTTAIAAITATDWTPVSTS